MTITNDRGLPISKWRATDRWEWAMAERFPDIAEHMEKELLFVEHRKWRFDYAWPGVGVAVEIHGIGRGHTDVQKQADNFDKINCAITEDWTVFVFNTKNLQSMERLEDAVDMVCQFVCDGA